MCSALVEFVFSFPAYLVWGAFGGGLAYVPVLATAPLGVALVYAGRPSLLGWWWRRAIFAIAKGPLGTFRALGDRGAGWDVNGPLADPPHSWSTKDAMWKGTLLAALGGCGLLWCTPYFMSAEGGLKLLIALAFIVFCALPRWLMGDAHAWIAARLGGAATILHVFLMWLTAPFGGTWQMRAWVIGLALAGLTAGMSGGVIAARKSEMAPLGIGLAVAGAVSGAILALLPKPQWATDLALLGPLPEVPGLVHYVVVAVVAAATWALIFRLELQHLWGRSARCRQH